MSNLQSAIYTILSEDPTVGSLVNYTDGALSMYSIHPISVPLNVLQKSDNHITYKKMFQRNITEFDLEIPIIQIVAISKTASGASDLRDGIIEVLERFRGDMGGKRTVQSCVVLNEFESKSEDGKFYYNSIDFKMKLFGNNI